VARPRACAADDDLVRITDREGHPLSPIVAQRMA
jgi:hypothetical protein